jgi:hypothetical protein
MMGSRFNVSYRLLDGRHLGIIKTTTPFQRIPSSRLFNINFKGIKDLGIEVG